MSHAHARAHARALEGSLEHVGVAAGSGRAAVDIGPDDARPAEALRDVHARASALVAGIAADAAEDPELYLRTTVVPGGGE